MSPSSKFFCYFRLLQSHRSNVSKELNRLRFHWGTRTAREEEESRNIGAVERDGDEEVVLVAVAVGKCAAKFAKPLLLPLQRSSTGTVSPTTWEAIQ